MKFLFPQCYFSCVNLITLQKWSPFKTVTFENCYQGIFFSSVRNHGETHLSHLTSQQAIALGTFPAFTSSLDVPKSKSPILFTCGWLVKRLSQLRIPQKSQHYPNKLQKKEPPVRFYWCVHQNLPLSLHINRDGSISASKISKNSKNNRIYFMLFSCFIFFLLVLYWCWFNELH